MVIEETDNEEIDKEDVNKEAIKKGGIDKEEMDKDEEEESLDDLPVFERQTEGRATVCLGDMKPRWPPAFTLLKWMMAYIAGLQTKVEKKSKMSEARMDLKLCGRKV